MAFCAQFTSSILFDHKQANFDQMVLSLLVLTTIPRARLVASLRMMLSAYQVLLSVLNAARASHSL